jgi:hypothetical protein
MRPRKYPNPFPGGYGHGSRKWLYAIGLTDGRIKVGMTGKPRERASQHCRGYGALIEWYHLGPIVDFTGSSQIERAVLHALAAKGERVAQEVFRGLSKSEVIATIRFESARKVASLNAERARQAIERKAKQRMQRAWEAFKAEYVDATAGEGA